MGLRRLVNALTEWQPGRSLGISPLQEIAAAWPGIVGDDVAAHCAPLSLNGTTLLVAVGSSAWSQQLQFLSPTILAAMRSLQSAPRVERIAFRVGAVRPLASGRPAVGATQFTRSRRPADRMPAEAPDLASALARLRKRVTRLREAALGACAACGTPMEREGGLCAPCRGGRDTERARTLERLLFTAPWLGWADLREQLPGLSSGEYEAVRRGLLQRWWLLLERARRAARPQASRLERQIGSSYVLLHSRLPPDRMTPAVVRNLLGADLEARLWPEHATAPVESGVSSKTLKQ